MGCWYSRVEREEMVTRCRGRKRYMKELVRARQFFSAAHSFYLRSLTSTGSSLLRFSASELTHHHAPMSPTSISWTTSSATPSTVLPPPPPPPISPSPNPRSRPRHAPPESASWTAKAPPPPPSAEEASVWDFWDPFVPGEGSRLAACVAAPAEAVRGFYAEEDDTSAVGGSDELAMVVSCKSKDLVEIIKELNDYFLKAAEAGSHISHLLEIPTTSSSSGVFTDQRSTAKVYGEGNSLSPLLWSFGSCRRSNSFGNFSDKWVGTNNSSCGGSSSTGSHHSTVERLYAWEKKLYQEVKNAHQLKIDHEKKTDQLRKLELKRADYVKTEKTKKEVEKLESRLMVASQAIESTSAEIVKVRESELYPQLVELVKGLTGMWRSLYEFHQVQTHIVKQLKYINMIPSMDPTSEIHRQSTLQLELEVQQWHLAFCNLVKSQREYVQSLTGWLRLSLFQFTTTTPFSKKTRQDSLIYSLCEEWHLSMDRIPDKVASDGIKSFLNVIHAIVIQQAEEQKQKKKSEIAFKELEKKAIELRSTESKYGPYPTLQESVNGRNKNPVLAKRAKVEVLKRKAEEEKAKHEKSVSVTRAMTMNNLQMGLPHVFEAVTGFANVCIDAYETVYNQAKNSDEFHDVKSLLP